MKSLLISMTMLISCLSYAGPGDVGSVGSTEVLAAWPDSSDEAKTYLCLAPKDHNNEKKVAWALDVFHKTMNRGGTGPLSPNDFSEVASYGCTADDINKGFMNFYEVAVFKNPLKLASFVEKLNVFDIGKKLNPAVKISSIAFRRKVATIRALLSKSTGDEQLDTQVTPDLDHALQQLVYKLKK